MRKITTTTKQKKTLLRSYSRIHEEDVVGNRKVESHASGLKTDEEDFHPRVVLECLKNLVKKTMKGEGRRSAV